MNVEKFIPYEKMSRKAKRKLDAQKRRGWDGCRPVSRTEPSAKTYCRRKKHRKTEMDWF